MRKPKNMHFLWLRKFIWLILYTLVHLWFMAFNWKLFITMLNVNLGFGVFSLPPFVVLFFTGFVILVIQSWTGYVNKLHRIIHDLEGEVTRLQKKPQAQDSKPPVSQVPERKTDKEEGKSMPFSEPFSRKAGPA